MLRAVDQGELQLDDLVSQHWPEYACEGKELTTVRQVLAHQAGLPAFRVPVQPEQLYDWTFVTRNLALQAPWWVPGAQHGYHARTLGFLLGEILKRATGRTVAQWVRDDLAEPLDADFFFQLNAAQQARCADMIPAKIRAGAKRQMTPAMQRMAADFVNPETVTGAAFGNPSMPAGFMNKADFRGALIPAMNGHGNARGIARILAALPELLSAETLAQAATTHVQGPDAVLKSKTRFGLGFMLYEEESPIGWPGCLGQPMGDSSS